MAYYTEKFRERKVSGGAIYVINFGMPADIKHEISLGKSELVSGMPPGITPGWEPNSEAIYYITADGLMHYCFEEQEPTKNVPASELSGLIQKNEEIPSINMHAFNIVNDSLQLAYVDFDENIIKVLSLEDEVEEKVIDVETKIKETWYNELDILFNGKYLALRQGLIIETETGEKVGFGNEGDILSYAWNREDRLVVLTGEEYGEGYELEFKLLDSDLEEIETLSTLAPEPEITKKGFEVTSYNGKWLFGMDGEIYYFDFK